MTINEGSIRLLKSAVMDDVDDGGGRATNNVIADGLSNSVFPDISELDRAGGRVNLRKTFVGINTADTDGYFGANVIVANPPTDPRVSITLFSTKDGFDQRESAASRMESYLGPGSSAQCFLFENHVFGQRAIQLFSRPGVALPSPGETIVLRWHLGLPDQKLQYVRVIKATTEIREFSEVTGGGQIMTYKAAVTSAELSDPLRYDFIGSPPSSVYSKANGATDVIETLVTDSAVYCGCVPLSIPGVLGEKTAKTSSVYTQLVPSSQTENVVLDQNPSSDRVITLAAAPRLVQVNEAGHSQRIKVKIANRGYNYVTILTPLPNPGSLAVSYRALGKWYTITDAGTGTLSGSGGGSVTYTSGSVSITLQALPDVGSEIIFSWGSPTAYTDRSGQAGWRAPELAFQLDHQGIVPGTFEVTWTSNSVIKTAVANASGVVSGHATGEVNHATGMVFLRPTTMPDAGVQFVCDYDYKELVEEVKYGLTPDAGGIVAFTTAQEPAPKSMTLTWATARTSSVTSGSTNSGGSTLKTAGKGTTVGTADKAYMDKVVTNIFFDENGNEVPGMVRGYQLSGGIGNISSESNKDEYRGHWESQTTYVPSTNKYLTASTSKTDSTGSTYTTNEALTSNSSTTIIHTLTDNGVGGFIGALGTVSYAGKSVSVKVVADWTASSYKSDHENANDWAAANESTTTGYNPGQPVGGSTGGSATAKGGTWASTDVKEVYASAALMVSYCVGSASVQTGSTSYTMPGIVIDLAPYTTDRIVPGSVQFNWMGTVYQDFEGMIYRGRTGSNPGVLSGVMNYTTGIAAMTDYVVDALSFSLDSLWTSKGSWQTAAIFFRTPVAPLKPGGLIFSVLDISGTQIIATAGLDGIMSGPHCLGKIDYETGVVEVLFGDYVLDSGLTTKQKAEWWYNPALVGSTGLIWKPWPVDPQTLRYNAVSYFYLPLDAELLGLDPVRLPQDGRVPIFRPGGFVVMGNTQTVTATVANTDVVNLGRTRLARIRVLNNAGAIINNGYSVDLDAGTITFTDITGYVQPIKIEHRVEDLLQVSDVQIGGELGFTRPLTHNYPATTSYLSSALIIGDMRARVANMFDQQTWASVFSDALVGNAAPATFNDVLAPLVVTNAGAITERWAIVFTSSTTFNVVGEHVGLISTGNTSSDLSPANPSAPGLAPYFTIPAVGWGAGWAAGNVLRFNTFGALFPVWIARTIQQGPATAQSDNFTLLIRGDIDRP